MRVAEGFEESLAAKFQVLFPHLDERQRRLVMGAEARVLGHGGIRLVARAAGVREATVALGVAELDSGEGPLGRARRPGGGRKRVADVDPGLRPALLALVEPGTRGDPMSPLRWTTKSTRKLAEELTRQGHRVSADTVGDLLRAEGFSLQGNAKTIEGRRHPDRDAQFRYIGGQVAGHLAAGQPVISVDAKKKEKVGNFANGGREYGRKGRPARVRDHDFPDGELGKAVPYGIYDVAANTGWVNVGTDGDTAAFAVESIRRWWQAVGALAYPAAGRLLITADAGGSNGYRTRAWKAGLAALAAETGLDITVCHFPPGTSKWNRIEHRLFSAISMNWRGRPLTSHEVIVETIAATTTRTGLTVHAELDTGSYPAGVRISDQHMAALPITRHDFHGDWNYCLHQDTGQARGPAEPGPQAPAGWDRATLAHPALTGLPRNDLDDLAAALAGPWSTQREQDRHQRRGSDRQRAPGAGPPPKLTLADRVLATLLHQHLALPYPLLAQLLGVNRTTISRAIQQTRPLLDQHGLATAQQPAARLRTLAGISAYAARHGIITQLESKSAC
jgi:Rhodopirellula transposase DDE domain/Helix-turn-helix of DDE superfamily endonuclease